MKTLVYIIGIIAILAITGFAIFHFVLRDDQKREILRELDLEDNPILKESAKTAYVNYEVVGSRKNLLGDKWVIKTLLINTHESLVIRSITLRYHFSNGYEDRSYSVDLRSGRDLPSYVNDKITGHGNKDFLKVELIDAD